MLFFYHASCILRFSSSCYLAVLLALLLELDFETKSEEEEQDKIESLASCITKKRRVA